MRRPSRTCGTVACHSTVQYSTVQYKTVQCDVALPDTAMEALIWSMVVFSAPNSFSTSKAACPSCSVSRARVRMPDSSMRQRSNSASMLRRTLSSASFSALQGEIRRGGGGGREERRSKEREMVYERGWRGVEEEDDRRREGGGNE